MIIYHNDSFIAGTEKQFSVHGRFLRYGDGFFETIIARNAQILWLSEHYNRIVLSAKILKMEFGADFSQEKFATILGELLRKNNLTNARFRVVFYRQGEGLYHPQKNDAGVFITCFEFEQIQDLNVIEKTAIFAEKKAVGSLANVKSCNALLFVMATIFAKEQGAQEAIILNTNNNICEATTANIFILSNGKIVTPALHSGCVSGVMRAVLLRELRNAFDVSNIEEREISIDEMLAADAVFLTNVAHGIQAVKSIDDKYFATALVEPIYALYQKMLESVLE